MCNKQSGGTEVVFVSRLQPVVTCNKAKAQLKCTSLQKGCWSPAAPLLVSVVSQSPSSKVLET